jgi:hypothetical protein
MRLLLLSVVVVAVVGLSISTLRADDVATTQPSDPAPSLTQIQKWFDDLANTEPARRDVARSGLLGLGRQDLPELLEVVRRSTPLAPAQATVLHDVVTHVWLSGEAYPSNLRAGFLGVMLQRDRSGLPMVDGVDPSSSGVLILDCMPGFCGFRSLRPGDIVVGAIFAEPVRISTRDELVQAVSATPPGKSLRLQVLRHGRVAEIPVQVNARPLAADDPAGPDQFLNERQVKAEEYWRTNFLPVSGGVLSLGSHRPVPSNRAPQA